jgi:AcrR family transcriptional regulator
MTNGTDDTQPKRGRGRPRREGADEEILRVALDLLREQGYRAFSLDTIVQRTGIAKTTIYRRWPSKGALIAAALAPIQSTETVLDLVRDLDGDAIDVLRSIVTTQRPLVRAALADRPDADTEADRLLGAILVRLIAGS